LETFRTVAADASRGARQALVIRGTVKASSGVPRPGTVPYRDAITCLHLTNVALIQGDSSAWGKVPEAVVFAWGMRDNTWTSLASGRIGQTLKLRIVPWHDVADRYGRFARTELDDPELALMDLPTFWAVEVLPQ
jgi:alginate O-acetyltransferase complex protein AlgJ